MRPSGPVAAASATRATGRLATVCVGAQPPHTFEGPQLWGDVHVPHDATSRVVPQLSVMPVSAPHVLPRRMHTAASVSGTQAQTFEAWHVCGEVDAPHDSTVREVPQLSFAITVPQPFPSRAQN